MEAMAKKTPLADFLSMVWRRFQEDRCLQIASSLTFTTLLALVPIITVMLTLMSLFPVFSDMVEKTEKFFLQNMLPESVATIAPYTEQFTQNAGKLTAVGIVFLFVTSIIVLMTIERALNGIWRVARPRSVVQRVFIYWALLTVGPILVGASLSLTSWLVGLSLGLVEEVPLAAMAVLNIVPVLLTGVACTLLYLTLPNRRVLLRDAALGGFLAAIGFEWMKHGFALYITQFATYQLVYGAFASLPIFLLWVYLSWVVVLTGAVVAAVAPEWRQRASQGEPAPGAVFIDALYVLKLLWQARAKGNSLTLAQLHAAVKLQTDRTEALLDEMKAMRWVAKAGRGWMLVRDASDLSVAEVYHLFVFRAGTKQPARQAGPELDALARHLEARIEEIMHLSVEELFRRSAPSVPESCQRPLTRVTAE